MFTTQFGLDLYAKYLREERLQEAAADRLARQPRGAPPEPHRLLPFRPLRRLHRVSLVTRPAW